ncbi:MAG: radical SAM family heme chaperone HemW [Deltaproteobacteria bacterium]|nr:radical SAM family heme chaperone HemW [Deltaproteobacteria bacterium]
MNQSSLGIYLHTPFCVKKCAYCDFYSITDRRLIGPYVDALKREIQRAECLGQVDTVYWGGGTPSILPVETVAEVMDVLAARFEILPDAEISLEANPGTVNSAYLKELKRTGINRLNLGVQSLNDQDLSFLGRIHNAGEAVKAIDLARQAGFENLGIDLIYGLPGQTRSDLEHQIRTAAALTVEHISCYLLTLEPATPLARRVAQGTVALPDETQASQLMTAMAELLAAAGYHRYEISNFAREERYICRHNRRYWTMAPYLGFGPAAHSFVPPRRYWNLSSVSGYIEAITDGRGPVAGSETLTREQRILEAVYLDLRLIEGIDLAAFESVFQVTVQHLFGPHWAGLLASNILEINNGWLRLTEKGLLLADAVPLYLDI